MSSSSSSSSSSSFGIDLGAVAARGAGAGAGPRGSGSSSPRGSPRAGSLLLAASPRPAGGGGGEGKDGKKPPQTNYPYKEPRVDDNKYQCPVPDVSTLLPKRDPASVPKPDLVGCWCDCASQRGGVGLRYRRWQRRAKGPHGGAHRHVPGPRDECDPVPPLSSASGGFDEYGTKVWSARSNLGTGEVDKWLEFTRAVAIPPVCLRSI